MVKLEKENGKCQVIAFGNAALIAAEIGECILHLWRGLSPEDQEDIKGLMQYMMADESPVWKLESEGPVS